MLQINDNGNSGILLKVTNKSKSRKRVIQTKNINFNQDHLLAQKFQSLPPNVRGGEVDTPIQYQEEGHQASAVISDNRSETLGVMLKNRKIKISNLSRYNNGNQDGNQQVQQPVINIQKLNKKIELIQDIHGIINRAQSQAEMKTQKSLVIPEHLCLPQQQNQQQIIEDRQLSQQQSNFEETKISNNMKQKASDPIRNDYTPTTAASSNKRESIQTAELMDLQSGLHIQQRKKVERRLDLTLESRGSVFTGRDEQQILQQSKKQQQIEIQQALKLQIEDKKQRQIQEKAKQDQFESNWTSPKTEKRKNLDSQGDSLFSGLMSPVSNTKFSFSPHIINGVMDNQKVQQQQLFFSKFGNYKHVLKDILEEERSADNTTLNPTSPIKNNFDYKVKKNVENGSNSVKNSNIVKQNLDAFQMRKSSSTANMKNLQRQSQEGLQNLQIEKSRSGANYQSHSPSSRQGNILNLGGQSSTQEATQDTENHSTRVIPRLEFAKNESQKQIDSLSTMVDQLLAEQNNLKNKISQQERILEGHIGSKEDGQISGQTTQRTSSRDFKIRKSKGSIMLNQKKQSKEQHQILHLNQEQQSLLPVPDQEVINRNVIMNHQINLKNQNQDQSQELNNHQQNQRYSNRQSNKLQFLERNEKQKQKNHLIKFGPANQQTIQKTKVQSLEPIRESIEKYQNNKSGAFNQNGNYDPAQLQILQEKFAVTKSIDSIQRDEQVNNKLVLSLANLNNMKPIHLSQENLKFSQSNKNYNLPRPLQETGKNLMQTQNLDFAGQSQFVFFLENKKNIQQQNSNFLPDIKKTTTQTQEQNRNPAANSYERFSSGEFKNSQPSNFKVYTNIEPSSKKTIKAKNNRNEELEMISTIMMPDSILVENHMVPQQNNLINSQKFLSQTGGDSQQSFFKQSKQNFHLPQNLEQIDENDFKQTIKSNASHQSHQSKKSQINNKLKLKESNLLGMRKSNQKFFSQAKPQQINLAERLTFSNFNKDPNFEPIQIEQSHQAFYQNVPPPQVQKRQSPSPAPSQFTQNRISINAPLMVIKKSSSNSRLGPISLIQKKVTPIKRNFPHDFFAGGGQQHSTLQSRASLQKYQEEEESKFDEYNENNFE
eukprot:403363101